MKLLYFMFILLINSFALSSQATELFVGVEGSPYAAWKDCFIYIECTKDASTDGNSKGVGIRIGYLLPPEDNAKSGVELVYEKFSSISGSEVWFPNGCSYFICNPPPANASWKNDGELLYIDRFAYMLDKNRPWTNGMLIKAGVFTSSVKTVGNYGLSGGTYERNVSALGIVLGAGYIFPLSEHFSARSALDMFFNVKVADPTSTTDTISDTLLNFSLGVDYSF